MSPQQSVMALKSHMTTDIRKAIINHKKKGYKMKALGYLGAFLGGTVAGAALGLLLAPEKGEDTRVRITDAVEDFCKKHKLNISRKDVDDLVDDIKDATAEE